MPDDVSLSAESVSGVCSVSGAGDESTWGFTVTHPKSDKRNAASVARHNKRRQVTTVTEG